MSAISAVGDLLKGVCSGILELSFPVHCIVCRDLSESYLCAKCRQKITLIAPPICTKCGIPNATPRCWGCLQHQFHFELARSAGAFEGTLRKAIHALKYRSIWMLAEPLSEVLIDGFIESRLPKSVDMIVPIPIHPSRKAHRGFNQSELIAKGLAKHLSIQMDTKTLVKSKKTPHQVGVAFEQRWINIYGSFSVVHPERVKNKKIMLIDDVITTGATLDEAARMLLDSGASTVVAYTLARSIQYIKEAPCIGARSKKNR